MTENYLLPTLSPEGWVQATSEQSDYLFAHFFASLKSQSHIYGDNVASFQWIIQDAQGDMDRTVAALKSTTNAYFGRYFDNIISEISYNQTPENSSQVNIDMNISFTDKAGKQFVLGKTLQIVNSKISKIVSINNTGS